jgi:hypothetical protein
MDEKIDQAIEKVLGMIRTNMNPDEAQKITQAAHNLAHVKSLMMGCAQSKRKGKDSGES